MTAAVEAAAQAGEGVEAVAWAVGRHLDVVAAGVGCGRLLQGLEGAPSLLDQWDPFEKISVSDT